MRVPSNCFRFFSVVTLCFMMDVKQFAQSVFCRRGEERTEFVEYDLLVSLPNCFGYYFFRENIFFVRRKSLMIMFTFAWCGLKFVRILRNSNLCGAFSSPMSTLLPSLCLTATSPPLLSSTNLLIETDFLESFHA